MASDMALTMATHAEMFFAIIVLLILVIAFLAYKLYGGGNKKKHTAAKSHFNNLTTGGLNPLWQGGSGDAGYGGPMTREETRFQAAAFGGGPSLFNGGLKSGMAVGGMTGSGGSGTYQAPSQNGTYNGGNGGLIGGNGGGIANGGHHGGARTTAATGISSGASTTMCGPGMVAVTAPGPGGILTTTCTPKGGALPTVTNACRSKWDNAATSEAQALATLGAFDHDAYGLAKLQMVVNGADSPGNSTMSSLSDANLASQLYHGGI
jgi:hypothetical protein